MRRSVARAGLLAAVSVAAGGCVYYNAMWSAKRLARDAQRFEARGQIAEARLSWARAADKAESIAVRHPRSRWADEALVLQGEGAAGSGDCVRAMPVLAKAASDFAETSLRERAQLATASCALAAGDAAAATRAVTPVLESRDRARRSTATLLAGRAALGRGDAVGAADLLSRSTHPAAAPLRVRALIAAGRIDSALAALGARGRGRADEADWAPVFDSLAAAAGSHTASRGLETFLAAHRLPPGARARLMLADGERFRAIGGRELDSAAARFASVVVLVPDSLEAGHARVRLLLLRAAAAGRLEDLDSLKAALSRIAQTGGAGAAEARGSLALLQRVAAPGETDADRLRSAELARDSLGAPRLAGALYLELVRRFPASLFAPKALVAALPLLPGVTDSLLALLDTAYRASPYTRALHGEASPGFTAAEDSLALALGMRPPSGAGAPGGTAARVAPPVPGPRGPALEPALPDEPTAAVRPGPRPLPGRPAARPTERPADRPERLP